MPDRDAELSTVRESSLMDGTATDELGGDGNGATGPAPGYVGMRCGPYQVIREIGRGGMGTVYLAARADEEYRKRVALKILRGFASEEVLGRFKHERQILASLEHPHIARLIDGGSTEQGEPYLVMDYVEGTPLDDYCDSRRLDVTERIKLFLQMCSAVQYVHRNLIVHRDLKPGNVLVTSNGTVKLLDFGIAKLLRDDLGATLADATRAREMLMTPAYASPEQARGEPITTASDVYSLGVMLYELLTGYRPYRLKTGNALEMIRVISEENPTRPSTAVTSGGQVNETRAVTVQQVSEKRSTTPEKLRVKLKGDLDNILMMALRKEPQRRYSSVEAFAMDLERHLNDFPVLAHEDQWTYRAAKFAKRNRFGVAAASVAVLALLIGLVATSIEWTKARGQTALAQRRFADVRSLATRFLFDINDSVQDLPGSTKARALIASTGTAYLDRLAGEAHGDKALQEDIAEGYKKVGDVEGDPFNPNLGQSKEAIASYRKAIAIGETLDAKDVRVLKGLAAEREALSGVLGMQGDAQGALAEAKKAVEASKQMEALDPVSAETKLEVARAYETLGDVSGGYQSLGSGRAEDAEADYKLADEAIPQLAAEDPLQPRATRAKAVLMAKLARLESRTGHGADAIEETQQSLMLADSLLKDAPGSAKTRDLRAQILAQLGSLYGEMGKTKESLDSYNQSLALDEESLKGDPADRREQRSVMIEEDNLAQANFYMTHDWTEALRRFKIVGTMLNEFVAGDPEDVADLDNLAVTESYEASVLHYLKRDIEARTEAGQSLMLAKKLADRPGASEAALYNFAWLATTMEPEDTQQPVAALPYAKRAVEMSGGHDAKALMVLGDAYFGAGDVQDAIATADRGLALFPSVKAGDAMPTDEKLLAASLAKYQKAQKK